MKQEPGLMLSLNGFRLLAPFGLNFPFWGSLRNFGPCWGSLQLLFQSGLCVREGAAREGAAPRDVAREGVFERL